LEFFRRVTLSAASVEILEEWVKSGRIEEKNSAGMS
jgi:hypothetical protein